MAVHEPASVAVVGAGAIGTVVAAAANQAGHRVSVCARTAVERLVLHSDGTDTDTEVPVRVTDDPVTVEPVDWVLLTTKAQDTAGAGVWLSRLCGPRTVVAVLQNGVEHVERVAPFTGGSNVLPAVVYISAERTAPGHVVHHRANRLIVPAGADGASFADLLAGSFLDVTVHSDFATESWRKLLTNVAANPITALTLSRVAVLRQPPIIELATNLLTETVEVGRAEGAHLDDSDVRWTLEFYQGFPDTGGTSMLYDRLAGRRTEHDQINGAVVRLGRRHGIPTPTNQAVLALLDALDPEAGQREPLRGGQG